MGNNNQPPTAQPRVNTNNGAQSQPPASYRPSYSGKSKAQNRFRNVRDLNEIDDDSEMQNNISMSNDAFAEHLIDNDFLDVVGELFVLEDVGQTTDRRLYGKDSP